MALGAALGALIGGGAVSAIVAIATMNFDINPGGAGGGGPSSGNLIVAGLSGGVIGALLGTGVAFLTDPDL